VTGGGGSTTINFSRIRVPSVMEIDVEMMGIMTMLLAHYGMAD
jgi:hypothetical protein